MRHPAAAVQLAVLLAVVGGTSACSAATFGPPPRPYPTSSPTSSLRLLTSEGDSLSGMEALATGVLSVDAGGCVILGRQGSTDGAALVWPRTYSVRGDARSFEVLDADRKVVARSGVQISMGGGAGRLPASADAACATSDQVWFVGQLQTS